MPGGAVRVLSESAGPTLRNVGTPTINLRATEYVREGFLYLIDSREAAGL